MQRGAHLDKVLDVRVVLGDRLLHDLEAFTDTFLLGLRRTGWQVDRAHSIVDLLALAHGWVIDVRLNELFRLVVLRSEGPDVVVDSALDHDGRTPLV